MTHSRLPEVLEPEFFHKIFSGSSRVLLVVLPTEEVLREGEGEGGVGVPTLLRLVRVVLCDTPGQVVEISVKVQKIRLPSLTGG
jgi:hypothetical protein